MVSHPPPHFVLVWISLISHDSEAVMYWAKSRSPRWLQCEHSASSARKIWSLVEIQVLRMYQPLSLRRGKHSEDSITYWLEEESGSI